MPNLGRKPRATPTRGSATAALVTATATPEADMPSLHLKTASLGLEMAAPAPARPSSGLEMAALGLETGALGLGSRSPALGRRRGNICESVWRAGVGRGSSIARTHVANAQPG